MEIFGYIVDGFMVGCLLWMYISNPSDAKGKYHKPRIAVHRTSGDMYYEDLEDYKVVLEREQTFFQDVGNYKPSPCF